MAASIQIILTNSKLVDQETNLLREKIIELEKENTILKDKIVPLCRIFLINVDPLLSNPNTAAQLLYHF